jgi:predicted DNA-binding ArsR family transcriptional regulator
MITPHLEKIFFHSIIHNDGYLQSSSVRFFDDETIRKVFPLVKEFREKYRDTPTQAQMEEIVRMKGVDVSAGQLETLWKIEMADYDEDWLRENTETFIEYKNLDTSIDDVVTYMRTTVINAENIKETVNKVKQIIQDKNSIDFAFSEGSDFFAPAAHAYNSISTFSTGYPFLDTVSGGGFSAKTLTCFVGQAKIGKCSLGTEYITVRSKKTGLIRKIQIKEFHELCMQNVREDA